ncbi:heavy metal-associated isoprenylated plant protein 41 isoform X3 [Dendrobium catenatum]|uniref:heavy metal-associated isoprenylated plant protein 41 isoform X3 n=1 Tax=Dendrobium catenatum TaxID=906689 RepID=UPI00109F2C05|nr:heavy metal-associated isoprenylated plant protein 41 isoform X3 [Dendrobium catenatum]
MHQHLECSNLFIAIFYIKRKLFHIFRPQRAAQSFLVATEEKIEEIMVEAMWTNRYCSAQKILLVGEGDFSFSLYLATAFGSAFNIVATSLDSYAVLLKKYPKAQSNVEVLKKVGATILHEIDATRLKDDVFLRNHKFDRIIFNFPHVGFFGKEDNPALISLHQELLLGFFYNASQMLQPFGEIHVRHKTSTPFSDWNLTDLAERSSLTLFKSAPFKIEDYPGYNNKRGDGSRSDDPFPLGKCSTFFFINNIDYMQMKEASVGKPLKSDYHGNLIEFNGSSCRGSRTEGMRRVVDTQTERKEHHLILRALVHRYGRDTIAGI